MEETIAQDLDSFTDLVLDICRWCGNKFGKLPMSRSLYCTQACRTKRQRANERHRMQTDYKYIQQVEPTLTYLYYLDNLVEPAHQVPVMKDTSKPPHGKKITVPDLKFKLYQENEKILKWSWEREKQRSYWE